MDSSQLLMERATAPYDVPETLPAGRGVHIYRTAIVMPFITSIFMMMRLYSKFVMKKVKPTIDDYTLTAAFILSIAHAVLMAEATRNGMGLHIWQYTPELNSRYYLWIGISSEFYNTSLLGFKVSLILLYLQLFGVNKKFRWCCYALIFYVTSYVTSNVLTEFLGCHPIEKKWNQSIEGHCINSVAANISYGFGHISSDLMIGILPLPMIWKMKFRTTREKVGLSATLTCGFITFAIAVVRWAIGTYNMLSYDRPWWAGISFLFSILEVNTGIICCCVATSSPLLRFFFHEVKSMTARPTFKYGSASGGSGNGGESQTRQSISVAKSGFRRLSKAARHPSIPFGGGKDHRHQPSKSRPSISSPLDYPAGASLPLVSNPQMAGIPSMYAPREAPLPPPTFIMPSYGSSDYSRGSHETFLNATYNEMDMYSPRMDWGGFAPHETRGGSGISGNSVGGGSSMTNQKRSSDEENLLRMV